MFIFVFVGKKIISTDTIVPIIMEVKKLKPATKVFFITPDKKTLHDLSDNKTLYSFILDQCSIIRIGGLQGGRFKQLIQSAYWICILGLIFLLLRFKKAKIIHFGLIEGKPRNILAKNPNQIFYFENNSWGTGVFEDKIQSISHNLKPPKVVKFSGNLVGFDKNWSVAKTAENESLTKYFLTPSKLWPCWKAYIDEIGPTQWKVECKKFNISEKQKVFLIILGTLDGLPSFNMGTGPIDDIVIETINIISKASPQIPIILKPHAITDKKRLNAIVSKTSSKNVHITYLHPCVLARHVLVAICNYYSTSLIDLWHYNVPTIEYTRYSRAGLEITGGGSMRPEYVKHFIEIGKNKQLANIITKYGQESSSKFKLLQETIALNKDDEKLINKLVN